MTNPKLELFFFNECPFCQRVLNKIDQLGIKDKITFFNIREDSQAFTRLQKDTGRRTTPCLYIDNKPMHESLDIMQWLEKNC